MPKYLWELDLENIPCGWEDTYKDALINCPNGEIFYDYLNNKQIHNPVEYKQLTLSKFNYYKKRALALMKIKDSMDLKDFINKIVDTDIALYSLLYNWISRELEYECFNPKNIENDIDFEYYFTNDMNPYPPQLVPYNELKIIRRLR